MAGEFPCGQGTCSRSAAKQTPGLISEIEGGRFATQREQAPSPQGRRRLEVNRFSRLSPGLGQQAP